MKLGYKILIGVAVVLVVARIAAPAIILSQMNKVLADVSPVYYAHVDDFDLSLWRGAYRFEKATISLKQTDQNLPAAEPFARAEVIDVSVSWRELFRGRIMTDVIVDKFTGHVTEALMASTAKDIKTGAVVPENSNETKAEEAAIERNAKSEAKAAGQRLFPVDVQSIVVRNSEVLADIIPGFSAAKPFKITGIEAHVSNVLPTEANPISPITARGSIMGLSVIKLVGSLNLMENPSAWLMAAEMRDFNLVDANNMLAQALPLTFKAGRLDLYGEVKSEEGKITGYVKPFAHKLDVVGDSGDFKSLKHFGIETGVAAVNLLFRNAKDNTVATKILFSYDQGEFKWNASETIATLFRNGYEEELTPGVENLLVLKSKKL